MKRSVDPAVALAHVNALRCYRDVSTHAPDTTIADSRRLDLQAAVDAARAAGLGWSAIGDALDVCAGNAYQRFRHRPTERPTAAEMDQFRRSA